MADFIVAMLLLIVVGTAIVYIVKEKKKGTVCMGCPNAGNCAGKQHGDSDGNCH